MVSTREHEGHWLQIGNTVRVAKNQVRTFLQMAFALKRSRGLKKQDKHK